MWILYLLLIVLIMIFSNASIEAAQNAVELFAYSIVPSLFPFFVLTNMLLRSGKAALLPGFLCGYPTGAIACATLYQQGSISRSKAETFSSFTSNAGPTFVLGAVGVTMCRSVAVGSLLLLTHMAAALTTMLAIKLLKKDDPDYKVLKSASPPVQQPADKIYFGEQLTNAIVSALKQIAAVGGYILFFAVLIGILKEIGIQNGILFSLLEITTGLKYLISSLPQETFLPALIRILPLAAFLLGFSGLCIHAQIIAILNKGKLRSRFFILGKLMQAVFAGLYTYLLLKLPVVVNAIYELPVFSSANEIVLPVVQGTPILLFIEALPVAVILFGALRRKLVEGLL